MSQWYDEDEDNKTGTGGKSGEVNFRFKTETYRDEQLPQHEINRLLDLHRDAHKAHVDQQKLLRKEREIIKESRKGQSHQHRVGYGPGGGGGSDSRFKKHPISSKAQFSGGDNKSQIPSENAENTNDELRNKLENRHNYNMQPTRQFNPKPSPF